jgi:hypothetical protein
MREVDEHVAHLKATCRRDRLLEFLDYQVA